MGIPPPKPAAGPPVLPFPRKSDITLVRNKKLNDAVGSAINDDVAARHGPPAKFAMTIVDPGNSFAMGGFNDDDQEYYTGSLVKIGVLYSAYALLEMVRRYAALRSPKSAADLFKGLGTDMGGAIRLGSKLISGAKPNQLLPSYKDVFTVKALGGKLQIDFSTDYRHNLRLMMVNSDNDAAGTCIHGLGFGYLNGALEQGEFFDPTSKTGVWAAGDFRHGWTPVRIPCVNLNGGTAQGATTQALARLMAVIVLGDVLDDHNHVEMNKVLMDAAHGSDPSFLIRKAISDHLSEDQVTHAKIGIGESPDDFLSEVEIVKGIGKARSYIVAWQNVVNLNINITQIIAIITKAITAYES